MAPKSVKAWNTEVTNLKDQIGELEEAVKTLQKEKDKLKIRCEKEFLRGCEAERSSVCAHVPCKKVGTSQCAHCKINTKRGGMVHCGGCKKNFHITGAYVLKLNKDGIPRYQWEKDPNGKAIVDENGKKVHVFDKSGQPKLLYDLVTDRNQNPCERFPNCWLAHHLSVKSLKPVDAAVGAKRKAREVEYDSSGDEVGEYSEDSEEGEQEEEADEEEDDDEGEDDNEEEDA